jgi:putative serine protease PepD
MNADARRASVVVILLIIIATLASVCAFAFFKLYQQSEAQWSDVAGSEPSMIAQGQAIPASVTSTSASPTVRLSQVDLVAQTKPSVVHITTSKNVLGSGFVIGKSGYIVTNAHVIQDTTSSIIRFTNGKEYLGLLIGKDVQADLALIKINASNLRPLKIADSSMVKQGDTVYMIGYSLGFSQDPSFRSGILSRTIFYQGMAYLEVSSAIYPGDSGSPLLDSFGRLIGINTKVVAVDAGSIAAEQSLKLAVPSNTLKRLLPSLVSQNITGFVTSTLPQF